MAGVDVAQDRRAALATVGILFLALSSGCGKDLPAQNFRLLTFGTYMDLELIGGAADLDRRDPERRQYHAESNETVAEKFAAARKAGLVPLFCIGETLEERESGTMEDVLAAQVAILVFANWVRPDEPHGLWFAVWRLKWWLTAAGAVSLAVILVRWYGLAARTAAARPSGVGATTGRRPFSESSTMWIASGKAPAQAPQPVHRLHATVAVIGSGLMRRTPCRR